MKKQKLIMKLAIGILLSVVLLPTTALAQENGKIYQLSYSPDEPVVFEEVKVSIGVENPSNTTRDYLMRFQITKNGKLTDQQEFTFILDKSKGIFFVPEYSPKDIGEHEIIIKLYDRFQIDLYDVKIIKFNAVSHLGPFDIVINPLTTRVRPGIALPMTALLENFGMKGTDVEVKVSINCPDRVLSQSFTVFVPAQTQTQQLVNLQTCENEGLYDITASIILFNKTWVSSTSQFFVNSSYIQLQFDVPDKLTLNPGESYSFPVEVTNLGNQKINNLNFVIQRIPLSWQKTSPSSIIEVEPNEKVVFIVNITVPPNAEAKSYEIMMIAAAEEVLERGISTLDISPLAVAPVIPVVGMPVIKYVLISISSAILVAFGILLRNHIKRQPKTTVQQRHAEILKKIKEKVKSEQR